MIDYIRSMNLNIDPSTILNNKLLRFPQLIDPKTGEIINRNRYAAYKGLRFTVSTDGNLRLSGSLHMYKNNGEHNHDDFIYADLVDVVQELNKEFGIELSRMETEGKGELQPTDTNATAEGKANNRRVEFIKL